MTTKTQLPLQLGDPVEHRGIVIAPLFPRSDPLASYLTLEQAAPIGFHVTELDEAGSVPELLATNPLDANVLLYDGEELLGAKQNRILNVTVLVGASSKTRIPVSCVEEGRWHARSARFSPGGQASHPELRRRKAERLASSPLALGLAQHEVWEEVRAKSARLRVDSPTGAQSDVFAAHDDPLSAMQAAFPLVPGQSGAVLAIGDSFCVDYVSRPDAFAKLYPKLLRGYLLDALERLDGKPSRDVEPFVASVAAAPRSRADSVGLGEDVRLAGDRVIGSGLELDGELIQLCAFSSDGRTARTSIARPSARR
jgi:hypothetical protein